MFILESCKLEKKTNDYDEVFMLERFVIVEIGSTNTKIYLYENNEVKDLGFKTIEFKSNYKKKNKIDENDKELLFELIKSIEEENIFVFGTSIFRTLKDEERDEWLQEFKDITGLNFNIVTYDMENELTVYGAVADIDYDGKIAVMIGGGGSTELSIVKENKIIEKCNFDFGAADVTDMFPDLKSDYATSNYDEMLIKIKRLINNPINQAELMILAGGDYIYFYEQLEYPVEKNKFYDNKLQPYCLDVLTMDKLDRKFFYESSLEGICRRTNKDGWWRGARGMRLCVKSLVDILEIKYIIPTRISMVYGIVEQIKSGNIIK